MPKLLKRSLYLLASLAILALIAISILLFWVNPNHYRGKIEAIARDKANLSLTIEGDLSWSFFPWIGINVGKTAISALDDDNNPIASADSLSFSLKLIPLLKGEIDIDQLTVDSLDLKLLTDNAGNSNIDAFFPKRGTGQSAINQASEANPQPHQKSNAHKALSIRKITFVNTTMMLENQQSAVKISGENIDFTIDQIDLNAPQFSIKSLAVERGNLQLINLRSHAILDYQAMNLQLDKLVILQSHTPDLRQFALGIEAFALTKGEISYHHPQKRQFLKITPDKIQSQKLFFSSYEKDAIDPWQIEDIQLKNLALQYQATTHHDIDSDSAINYSTISLKKGMLQLKDLSQVKAGVLSFSGIFQKDTSLDLDISGNAQLGLDLRSGNHQLSDINIETNLRALPAMTLINPTIVTLKGALNVEGATDQISGALKLSGGDMAIRTTPSEHSTPQATSKPISSSSLSPTQSEAGKMPAFSALKNLNIHIEGDISSLHLDDTILKNIVFKTAFKDESINFPQVFANTLGGSIAMSGHLNGQTPSIIMSSQVTLKDIVLTRLFALLKKAVPLTGNLHLTGDFKTEGTLHQLNFAHLMQNLEGSLKANITNGSFIGVDYEALACQGLATINKQNFSQNTKSGQKTTRFKSLNGNATIRKGIIRNNALKIEIPGLNATGNGTINLNLESLDYRINLDFQALGSAQKQCAMDSFLKHVAIPLRCQGSYTHAGNNLCGLDQDALGKMIADTVKSTIESTIKDALKENLPPALQPNKPPHKSPNRQNRPAPKPQDVIKAFEGLFK